ncbi:MAG: hypothetical protein A2017_05760 [Lentisphaerae bacterium GWF2_44_16]|nr:MAG: hypothetical protein A2017_05760 [Lentisphaerae bacterium GWF2_44_16]
MGWKRERALVFGGGGFLGRAIIRQLMDNGVSSIVSFGRSFQPELKELGVEHISGDLRDMDAVYAACKNSTVVFHTAAKAGIWGKWPEYYGINVEGTLNVLKGCLKNSIPVMVYTSSPSVAYPPCMNIENADEKRPYPDKFLAYYPQTKAMAEKEVLMASNKDFLTTALRPHLLWGPGDPHLLPRVVERARKGKLMIVGNAENLVDMTYVDNAASAHIKVAANLLRGDKAAAGKAYFISDDKPVNLWNWIEILLKRLDIPAPSRKISYRKAYFAGALLEAVYGLFALNAEPPMTRFVAGQLAFSHYFNISAAKKDFGYEPLTGYDEIFEKTLEFLKKYK